MSSEFAVCDRRRHLPRVACFGIPFFLRVSFFFFAVPLLFFGVVFLVFFRFLFSFLLFVVRFPFFCLFLLPFSLGSRDVFEGEIAALNKVGFWFGFVFFSPRNFSVHSPIAMLWGLAKLKGGRAPSGHRQSWWADGVPVMF